ncbi:MAG: DUF2127 domain-containing protein [Terracidiphilus sp.]|jgi:uncharacterized membrane protein (DUF2068 family)
MVDSPEQSTSRPKRHNRWLILIAVFKITQALLFIALGVGVLRLLHKDVGDMVSQFVEHLRFNPESHFVNFILVKASIVDDKMLRRISSLVFGYAAVGLVEGIGLYLEKTWAEYFTLVITASFLPWEIFEVLHKITWIRAGLLTVNILVFLYLLKVVMERARLRRKSLPS